MFNTTSNFLSTIGKAAAVSALAIGSLGVAGAAEADSLGLKDARGDLAHGADLRSVHVVNEKAVRVRVDHRNLVRDFRSGSSVKIYIDTDRSVRGPEFVFVGGTYEGADYTLAEAENWKAVRAAEPLTGSYEMKLNYRKDFALVRISQATLGNPEEVRVTVRTSGELADGAIGVDWLKGERRFTPWVARG